MTESPDETLKRLMHRIQFDQYEPNEREREFIELMKRRAAAVDATHDIEHSPLLDIAMPATDFIMWCEYIGFTKMHPWMHAVADDLLKMKQNGVPMRRTQLVPKGPARVDLPKSDHPARDKRMAFANAAGNHGVMFIIDDVQPRPMTNAVIQAMNATRYEGGLLDGEIIEPGQAVPWAMSTGDEILSDVNDMLRDMYTHAKPMSDLTVHRDIDHIERMRMLAPPSMGKSTYKQPMIAPGMVPETNRAERRAGRRNKPKQHLKGLR